MDMYPFSTRCSKPSWGAMQIGKKFNRGTTTEELPEYARATHLLATLGFQVTHAQIALP